MSLRKLGRYDIIRVLGKGAMGIVYEGRDPNLDRRVAIKTVKVENLAPEAAAEYEARFRTEARSAARLQHPNIVSVYDSDHHDDVAYLVMEYIQGDDLKHHLDNGDRYSLEQSLHMIGDLLSALDYAHRHGVVHRDIKPANLLLEASGRLKLTDFGVARMQDSEATRTQGAMVGTLKYMAPEQVQGQKIDARADLFAVGVILYQLLTDQRPFDGENEFAIIHQIIGHTPLAPSSVNARLPGAIDAVVQRALAKKPEDRFPTAADFAAALRAAVRHADDPTIVPPANPARANSLRSVTSPGTSPMGSATVTQELELVYWKDVKDSSDPEDLEVFLAKFPAGIYADLARRRLRKLRAEPLPDQTVLSGMAAEAPKPAATTLLEPVLADGTAPPQDALARAYAPTIAPAAAPDTPPGRTGGGMQEPTVPLAGMRPAAGEPALLDLTVPTVAKDAARDEQTTIPLVARASGAEPAAAAADATVARESAPPPARQLPPAVLAAIGALALVGIAAVTMLGRSGGDAPALTASGAASAPAVAAPSIRTSTAVPAVTTAATIPSAGAQGAPSAASHPAATSSAHARIAASHAKKALPRSAGAAPTEPARATSEAPAPPAVREQPRSNTATATMARPASSPVDQCKDKVLFSLEFCLAEQCDKPGARNHPLCVKRREEARLREESRVRN